MEHPSECVEGDPALRLGATSTHRHWFDWDALSDVSHEDAVCAVVSPEEEDHQAMMAWLREVQETAYATIRLNEEFIALLAQRGSDSQCETDVGSLPESRVDELSDGGSVMTNDNSTDDSLCGDGCRENCTDEAKWETVSLCRPDVSCLSQEDSWKEVVSDEGHHSVAPCAMLVANGTCCVNDRSDSEQSDYPGISEVRDVAAEDVRRRRRPRGGAKRTARKLRWRQRSEDGSSSESSVDDGAIAPDVSGHAVCEKRRDKAAECTPQAVVPESCMAVCSADEKKGDEGVLHGSKHVEQPVSVGGLTRTGKHKGRKQALRLRWHHRQASRKSESHVGQRRRAPASAESTANRYDSVRTIIEIRNHSFRVILDADEALGAAISGGLEEEVFDDDDCLENYFCYVNGFRKDDLTTTLRNIKCMTNLADVSDYVVIRLLPKSRR